jgi:hypothetical protein
MSLKDSHLHHVNFLKTFKDIWDQLQFIFQTKDVSSKVHVMKQFCGLKMAKIISIEQHLNKLN